MDDVTSLRIRTPPSDEVIEREMFLKKLKNRYTSTKRAVVFTFVLIVLTAIWACVDAKCC